MFCMRASLPALALAAALFSGTFTGCSSGLSSYPFERIKDSLAEICQKEYGIQELEVKIAGTTIGVFLPLKKLFAADFKEAAISGKIRNLETLFEPSPEALEKVEDVLFSISRVLLSTDRPFSFYVLQATDIEKTGLQLILTGFVDDIKRVRVWDISRNEYRKRVIHELKMNRAVKWHQPVRVFFKDLENLTSAEVQKKYFSGSLPEEAVRTLFPKASSQRRESSSVQWEILDVRSTPIQKNEVVAFTKVRPKFKDGSAGEELQFLFMLSIKEEEARLIRIIPFQFRDPSGMLRRVPLPPELQIDQNFDKWEREFPLEEVHLGPFLADQVSRRVQALVTSDERIQNTFREVKLSFSYREEANQPHFSMNLEASLKDFNHYSMHSLVYHEDMLYLLDIISREFVTVLRSYQFGDFEYLSLNVAHEPSEWVLNRDALELFRRKKIDLQGLLSLPQV